MENNPTYLLDALTYGVDVEIDLWYVKRQWWLGHDEPQYKTDIKFLKKISDHAWMHCKNFQALYQMRHEISEYLMFNYFWHQNDDYVLTSHGYIWTLPRKMPLSKWSICVLPELGNYNQKELDGCAGICSDHILEYAKDK